MFKETKQIAIVTGASSGIGKEFVIQIAGRYPRFDEIWVIARRRELLEELGSILKYTAPDIRVVCIEKDLSKYDELLKIKELLNDEKPCVRLLVNCAGYGKVGPFMEDEYQNQIGMIDVNCRALTAVTHMVLQFMPQKSRIIQLASAAAFLPQKNFAVYAASKSYVESFSTGLRRELRKRGISVTSVCPGPVDTEFFDVADPGNETKLYKKLVRVSKEAVVKRALTDASHGRAHSICLPFLNGCGEKER